MALGQSLARSAKTLDDVKQWPYAAIGAALEVIPRTLTENCGSNVIRTMTQLRAKHNSLENSTWGVDGSTGKITDMATIGVWEPYIVKLQTFKTAIESSCMILRIDDIVSGMKKKEG